MVASFFVSADLDIFNDVEDDDRPANERLITDEVNANGGARFMDELLWDATSLSKERQSAPIKNNNNCKLLWPGDLATLLNFGLPIGIWIRLY